MSIGRTQINVSSGMYGELTRTVVQIDFVEEGGSPFIVLHFDAPETSRLTSIRAPITRDVHDAFSEGPVIDLPDA